MRFVSFVSQLLKLHVCKTSWIDHAKSSVLWLECLGITSVLWVKYKTLISFIFHPHVLSPLIYRSLPAPCPPRLPHRSSLPLLANFSSLSVFRFPLSLIVSAVFQPPSFLTGRLAAVCVPNCCRLVTRSSCLPVTWVSPSARSHPII